MMGQVGRSQVFGWEKGVCASAGPVLVGGKARERGVSLIEVGISLFFVTVAFTGLASLSATSARGLAWAGDIAMASNLASGDLDELQITDFDSITGTVNQYYDRFGRADAAATYYFRLERTVTVEGDGFKDIQVIVYWRLGNEAADSHQVTMNGRIRQWTP